MNEYHKMCVARAKELAEKPYRLSAWQISQRTGLSEGYCQKIIDRSRKRRSARAGAELA